MNAKLAIVSGCVIDCLMLAIILSFSLSITEAGKSGACITYLKSVSALSFCEGELRVLNLK